MGIISKYVLDENLRRSAQRMKQVQDAAKEQSKRANVDLADGSPKTTVEVTPSNSFFPQSKR